MTNECVEKREQLGQLYGSVLGSTEVDPLFRGFFDHTRRNELAMPRCGRCRMVHWYPALRCPHCASPDWHWSVMAPQATVFTWSVLRHQLDPLLPVLEGHIVALAEPLEAPGARLVGNVLATPSDMAVGLDVTIEFVEAAGTELTLPVFVPCAGSCSVPGQRS